MTIPTHEQDALDAALEELGTEGKITREALDAAIARNPQFAAELTEFAADLTALELHMPNDDDDAVSIERLPASVSAAISHFHNQLHQLKARQAEDTSIETKQDAATAAVDPFTGLGQAKFKAVAAHLQANTLFVRKLVDRLIEPDTISDGCRRLAAAAFGVSAEAMAAHLAGPPVMSRDAFFKADEKPTSSTARQTFKEAVETSHLRDDQKRFLLDL